jgi:hypothetical protein
LNNAGVQDLCMVQKTIFPPPQIIFFPLLAYATFYSSGTLFAFFWATFNFFSFILLLFLSHFLIFAFSLLISPLPDYLGQNWGGGAFSKIYNPIYVLTLTQVAECSNSLPKKKIQFLICSSSNVYIKRFTYIKYCFLSHTW